MKRLIFALFLLWVLVTFGFLFFRPDIARLRTENPTSTTLIDLRRHQARKVKKPYNVKMLWQPLDEISPHLVHAVLLAEDDRFYQHNGFDYAEIRQAVKTNWSKKRYAYGGSTITQQLARTLYLSPRKNMVRKLREAIITYRLEKHLSKKRILELYLNAAEWGQGVYGAEAAAQAYFEKSSSELTPDEAVALASILPSPRRWSPLSEKAFMARRRSQLMERMRRAGYVEEPTADYDVTFIPALPAPETPPIPNDLQGVTFNEAPQQP